MPDRGNQPLITGEAMDWEQIESKWQAMARRIRADQNDSKAPQSEAEPAEAEAASQLDDAPITNAETAA